MKVQSAESLFYSSYVNWPHSSKKEKKEKRNQLKANVN